MSDKSSEEQLLEFLYACPVGLIECDMTGEIALMNPHAMQHLLPLAGPRNSSNLFSALEQHAPELRSIVADYAPATGKIRDGHRILVDLGAGHRTQAPKVLGCTLVKLGPDRLMVTLADISQQVVQEERLRQADTWFATLLDGVNEYAALTITPDGRIVKANAYFTRQTGYDCDAVTGRNLAEILDADPSGGDLHLNEQVEIATRDGWHLQEGWQRRADGGRAAQRGERHGLRGLGDGQRAGGGTGVVRIGNRGGDAIGAYIGRGSPGAGVGKREPEIGRCGSRSGFYVSPGCGGNRCRVAEIPRQFA